MKSFAKLHNYFWGFAFASLLISSCNKETKSENEDQKQIMISTSISTKVSNIDGVERFEVNDAISVYVKKGENMIISNARNNKTETTWESEPQMYWDGTEEHTIYAIYPYSSTPITDVTSAPVSVYTDQQPIDNSKKSDVLVANLWSGTPQSTVVPLTFDHVMSRVIVELTYTDEYNQQQIAGASVAVAEIATSGNINLANKIIQIIPGNTLVTANKTGVGSFSTIIIPQSFSILKIAIGGKTFEYTHSAPVDIKSAEQVRFRLKVGRDRIILDTKGVTIEPWELLETVEGGEMSEVVDESEREPNYLKWNGNDMGQPDYTFQGEGKINSPYLINTPQELAQFRNMVNQGNQIIDKYIKLMSDMDMSFGNLWTPIGIQTFPFAGNFDGNGKIIKLSHNDGSELIMGFFGYSSGTIKNLTITGSIRATNNVRKTIGGVVAIANPSASIENCHNKATIIGNGDTGGIVGSGSSFNVLRCSNKNNVNSSGSDGMTGGICGRASASSVFTDCFNTGTIQNNHWAGGIAGYCDGNNNEFNTCYNIGIITGTSKKGAITAHYTNSNVNNCYYDKAKSGNIPGIGDPQTEDSKDKVMAITQWTTTTCIGFKETIWQFNIDPTKPPKLKQPAIL